MLNSTQLCADAKVIRQPMYVNDIATAIKILIDTDQKGIFHLAGLETMTKYELFLRLKEILSLDCVIIPESINRENITYSNITISTKKAESLGIRFTPLSQALLQIRKDFLRDSIKHLYFREKFGTVIYGSNLV